MSEKYGEMIKDCPFLIDGYLNKKSDQVSSKFKIGN